MSFEFSVMNVLLDGAINPYEECGSNGEHSLRIIHAATWEGSCWLMPDATVVTASHGSHITYLNLSITALPQKQEADASQG